MTYPTSLESVPAGRTRCAFVGDESLVAQCAEIARAAGLDVVVIATQNDQVRDYAETQGIPVVDSGGDLATTLGAHRFDVLLSVANLRVLPDAVLDLAQIAVNFHDGPLPEYGGLNVTSWAILGGETEHAVTWHEMTSDVDAGDIIAVERFPILPDDTAFALNARCYEAALRSFPRVVDALTTTPIPKTPQPAGPRRMYGRYQRPAVLFDPATPAEATERTVRALAVGHRLRNTLGVVRLVLGDDVYVLERVRVLDATPGATPGQIVSIDEDGVRIATGAGDVLLVEITAPNGAPTCVREAFTGRGLGVGDHVPSPDAALAAELEELDRALARNEAFWLDRLAVSEPSEPPRFPSARGDSSWSTVTVSQPTAVDADTAIAAVTGWLARLSVGGRAVVAYADDDTRDLTQRLGPLVHEPFAVVDVTPDTTFSELRQHVAEERANVARRGPFLRDLVGRDPSTRERTCAPSIRVELAPAEGGTTAEPAGSSVVLRFVVEPDGRVTMHHRLDVIDEPNAERFAQQIATLLAAGVASPDTPVARLPLIGAAERAALDALNDTRLEHDRTATIDGLFRAQVARTPDAPALSFGSRKLTYAQLAEATDRLASRLREA
ncbi:MAG TPA: formyltransferase family protein, partial [Acidimicrobiales bacterium]